MVTDEQKEAESEAQEPMERIEPTCASYVSELHASLQILIGRLHDAVYMLPGRVAGGGAEARSKVSSKGYVSDLLEAGRRFEQIAADLPICIRQRSEERLRSEFSKLEQADLDATIDLDSYHLRVSSLQQAVNTEIQKTCKELCGDSVVCRSTFGSEAIDQSGTGIAPCPRLQDLVQEKPRRFVEELEFLECLANPEYVHWLASQTYFENPSFIEFLKYLNYWRSPPHVHFVRFPQALRMLEMMSNAQVRSRLRNPEVGIALTSQLMSRWAHKSEISLETTICSPSICTSTTLWSPHVGPAPATSKLVLERRKGSKNGADILRECDVLQDWSCLSGNLLANEDWHRKVEQAESSRITVQAMAERLGKNYLAKTSSGQDLESKFEKNRELWRCKASSCDIAEALVSLRSEAVPKAFTVPPKALRCFLLPSCASPSNSAQQRMGDSRESLGRRGIVDEPLQKQARLS